MTSTDFDTDKLMAFVFRAVDEVGATLNCALVVMGDRLGYYRFLAEAGPTTAAELARGTGTGEPYAREWLSAQAAGGFVEYDTSSGRFTLPAEYAVALTDENSPAFLPGFFQIALGTVSDTTAVMAAARGVGGVGWHERNGDVHSGCERFFRPGYAANLVDGGCPPSTAWSTSCVPAPGSPTWAAATARPPSSWRRRSRRRRSPAPTTTRVDRDGATRAADAALDGRATFEVAPATGSPGRVTTW
jgi:hypothetical protein